jgi:hypothetical protein
MKKASRYIPVTILVSIILTAAPSAFAAELPKEGRYDITACWSGVNNAVTFSKTHTATSYEITGAIRSSPPGGMFDKETFRCVGMDASLSAGRIRRAPSVKLPMRTATSGLHIFRLAAMES